MGVILSTAVGTATGFFVKTESGQRALKRLAATQSGDKFLKSRLGKDVKTFLSEEDGTINVNRTAVAAGVATGTGVQILTMLKGLFSKTC